jgi:UDP-N-acetyl-D-mannosaminuronic acid dehydrogenase
MNSRFDRISIIGLGYVGLPTAATIAARGVPVVGVDLRAEVVDRVNSGAAHIIEPDLDIVVQSVVSMGMLRAVATPEPAAAFIIAVPTPVRRDNAPDMRAVEQALGAIAPVLARGNLVVIESTSPVGTTRRAAAQLRMLRPDLSFPGEGVEEADVMLAYCPERILPGNTLRELTDNERLVGGLDRRSAERAHALYSIFAKGTIHRTDAATAEMVKLAENAFRDVNIAFANELSLICEASGIDPWQVIHLANLHPRVNILAPGPGVGGHCIPVDPWFIVAQQPALARLIRAAREVNVAKQRHVGERIARAAARFREPRIALLGLAYKPNVDDLRESPAVAIAQQLIEDGAGECYLVEPHLAGPPRSFAERRGVHWSGLDAALGEADIVAILVAHDQFRAIDRQALSEKIVIDAVGLLR